MFRTVIALAFGASVFIAQPIPAHPQDTEIAEREAAERLQQNPNDISTILLVAAIKMQGAGVMRGTRERAAALDEAQSLYERALSLDPNQTTALYTLGVLGWMRLFPELSAARAQSAMAPETPGPLRDRSARAVLNARYAQVLSDSLSYLERVLAIDPRSHEAMAYLNLLYRCKADLDETPAAAAGNVAIADGWVAKALATARAKEQSGLATNPTFSPGPPPPPPLPPAAMRPTTPQVIRISGNVQAANLVRREDPVYPEQARRAGIQGTVRFSATISRDGTIAQLQVVSGPPMLVQAALHAAKRWLYRPTLLNGSPVDVITTLDVNFVLPPGN